MVPFSFAQMLGKSCPPITIIDAGAMEIAEGGGEGSDYSPLVRAGVARVIGFEPVKDECDKLNAKAGKHATFLPHAVGNGNPGTFHVCNFPMTSSLFEPNRPLLKLFNNLSELTQVVRTEPIQTRRLDDIPECAQADFLKLDVQGAELDILQGAPTLLERVVVVNTEVEFVPLYKGQPLFADVDAFLRSRGFLIHSIPGIAGRAFKPLIANNNINSKVRQALWSQVTFVRDFTRFRELSPEQLLRLAVILHDMYGSYDLASLALLHHDARAKGGLWEAYLRRILGSSQLPPKPEID